MDGGSGFVVAKYSYLFIRLTYLVKGSSKGGGGVKMSKKTVHMVYEFPLHLLDIHKPRGQLRGEGVS